MANAANESRTADATQGDVVKTLNQDPNTGRFLAGNGGAQQLKLTPDRHTRIVQHVHDGNFFNTSARASGVSPRSLKRWMQRGDHDHDEGRDTPQARLFVDLREASAESEAKLVKVMQTAAIKGFKTPRIHKTTKKVPVKDAAGNVTYEEEVTEHVEITNVPPDWRACARLLESRAQSRFGNKRKVEVQGKFAHLHAHTEMSDADVKIAERVINSHNA